MQKLLWVTGRLIMRREKKKARVSTPFPLSNVPGRASTIFIFIIKFFFHGIPEGASV